MGAASSTLRSFRASATSNWESPGYDELITRTVLNWLDKIPA
jgi:hypothetical protein